MHIHVNSHVNSINFVLEAKQKILKKLKKFVLKIYLKLLFLYFIYYYFISISLLAFFLCCLFSWSFPIMHCWAVISNLAPAWCGVLWQDAEPQNTQTGINLMSACMQLFCTCRRHVVTVVIIVTVAGRFGKDTKHTASVCSEDYE